MRTPATRTAYVTNELDDTVSAIGEATDTVTHTIHVGISPYGLAVDPAAGTVYVADLISDKVSLIDAVTNTVIASGPGCS